jgi:cell fate regulator YaaT (PSP1 superfamily)
MLIAQVQFAPWDKAYNFSVNNLSLNIGDRVVVKTELGVDIGIVSDLQEIDENEVAKAADNQEGDDESNNKSVENEKPEEASAEDKKQIKPILRKATRIDTEKCVSRDEVEKSLIYRKKFIQKHALPMKLIDAHFSFDGSRATFAFISDGRVDFRELVKDLTRHFGRTIRLQQIGIRDEARLMGDFGHCGRKLCCRGFLDELSSITSEMAELQQCAHRGSDRISGVCGRLMCCLSYEEAGYEDMQKKFPSIGTKVDVDGKKGVIIGHHILKNSVDVEFTGENGESTSRVEVKLDRKKKK